MEYRTTCAENVERLVDGKKEEKCTRWVVDAALSVGG
jgi:hypothetical protein